MSLSIENEVCYRNTAKKPTQTGELSTFENN